MTTFTIDGPVLEAMLAFTSTARGLTAHPILGDVLCELTPESVRLVATDTHVLGLLHLTPILGYHLDIECQEPVSLVLPVQQMTPLLKDRKLPVTLHIEGLQVTLTNAAGMTLTLACQSAEEYPHYARVLALDFVTPTARTAYDLALLDKFARFAKALGVPPHLDLGFHGVISPASVRLAGLSGFYGVIMPRQLAYDDAIPTWLWSGPDDRERVIRLHDLDGVDTFTGTDDDGRVWTQFFVDALAEQEPGVCAVCGAMLLAGWQCLDGGEEVCDAHVQRDDPGDISPTVEPLPTEDDMPVAIPA